MNKDLTTFEPMAAFKDIDIKLPMLEDVQAYCYCPITHQPFAVPFNACNDTQVRMVLIGQLVFKASDLQALNIAHQTL